MAKTRVSTEAVVTGPVTNQLFAFFNLDFGLSLFKKVEPVICISQPDFFDYFSI